MRAALALAAVVACTPEVVPGSYLCGPERLCPEGQACNGPNNICVRARDAQPFVCGVPDFDDDFPQTGTPLEGLACPSLSLELAGCVGAADVVDFYQLDVPAGCAAARIEVSVTYPIAFQAVGLRLSTAGGAPATVETPCPGSAAVVTGNDVRCFSQEVSAGGHYAIGVALDDPGEGDCDGDCRHNRYRFRFRLATP